MPRKGSRSLKLSASLEAELDALVGTYLGNTRSEVITFILKEWLFAKREQLDRLKRPERRIRLPASDLHGLRVERGR